MVRIGQRGVTALGLALMTAACGVGEPPDAGQKSTPIQRVPTPENEFTPVELEAAVDDLIAAINRRPSRQMQMAVVLKNTVDYWAPIVTAASRAMGELDVTGSLIGPTVASEDGPESDELQNLQIAQTVADGAEGIALAPINDLQAAAIDDAVARGIPVVTLDTDVATSKRSIYVGTLDGLAGATGAETLLAMLPGPPGTVIIHGSVDTSGSAGLERTHNAQAALQRAGYQVLVRQSTWAAGGETEDVEWMANEIMTADPPVVGLLGLFNISYRCAMAAEAAGEPQLPVVAFDFDPKTVEYMREGRIQATHVQRQYYQGYLAPYILYAIKTIGLDATREILSSHMVDDSRVDTGLDVVTGAKIDTYNDFLSSINVSQ